MKTAVLRSVSHDLRSPITAIMTAGEVLADMGDSLSGADRGELVASILAQVRRLERLVANLLELSRLEAGAATPRRELWTIDGLVARVLDVVDEGNDRIDVDLPTDTSRSRSTPRRSSERSSTSSRMPSSSRLLTRESSCARR